MSVDIQQKLLDAIESEWIAEQALALVDIPSVTMDEAAICLCFERQLRDLGLEVDVREVTPGRSNLYARIPGKCNGPSLILNGHLDTIPIGSCPAPYRDGDRVYGRGATDMKGGMAAMIGAADAILRSGVQLMGDLWLTAVVGHEEVEARKDGPLAFTEDIRSGRVQGDRIVIAEGRDALWIMSMGSMVFTIRLDSDKAGMHTQYVPFDENPIRYVGLLIERIHERQIELDRLEIHSLAGAERIDLGEVHAGDYFNRTPVQCILSGTRRWNPGKTAKGIVRDLEEIAQPIADAGGLSLSIIMEHEREPFETPQHDYAVQAVAEAHGLVTGRDVEYVGMRIVGDANLYVNGCGVPTFYYGPSNETAHADIEWVSVDRMASAAGVYALAAANYCGVTT